MSFSDFDIESIGFDSEISQFSNYVPTVSEDTVRYFYNEAMGAYFCITLTSDYPAIDEVCSDEVDDNLMLQAPLLDELFDV